MIQALALVLAIDAGFEPVVLDVAHAELYLRTADGGASDAPLQVSSGTYMDDDTTLWLAQEKARARGERSVGPEIDTKTLTLVGAVMFAIGIAVGGGVVGYLWWTTR